MSPCVTWRRSHPYVTLQAALPVCVYIKIIFTDAYLFVSNYQFSACQILEVADSNVIDRGLVITKPKPADIIKEHSLYFDRDREAKNFDGEVLAYVTPVSIWLMTF